MKPRQKRKKKEEGYLSNKEMFTELMRCQEIGRVSDKLGKMYMILARRYASKPNFSGYSYKDEMISSGVVACVNALMKFNSERSDNPFAYYTSIVHNAFMQILNKEKKQQNIRDELLIKAELNPSFGYQERHANSLDPYENSD